MTVLVISNTTRLWQNDPPCVNAYNRPTSYLNTGFLNTTFPLSTGCPLTLVSNTNLECFCTVRDIIVSHVSVIVDRI